MRNSVIETSDIGRQGENDKKNAITAGGVLLILLGVLHAIHVARSDDVEPYLWTASLFLIAQGILTLIYMRRH